jgi:hypothetical protein
LKVIQISGATVSSLVADVISIGNMASLMGKECIEVKSRSFCSVPMASRAKTSRWEARARACRKPPWSTHTMCLPWLCPVKSGWTGINRIVT